MTLNNSMSITPSPPGQAKGAKFEHGSVLGGKTRAARVSSQWKSTEIAEIPLDLPVQGEGRMRRKQTDNGKRLKEIDAQS
jgi:hypothetical protein